MARGCLARPYALIGAIAVVVAVLPLGLPGTFYLRVAALVYINAIAVIGLNLLMGYAGQVSLGHAGFFGIGAYAVSLFPAVLGLPVWLSLIAGAVVSGLLAFIIGRPILRLRGYYLAVATLGLGLLIWMFFNNQSELTAQTGCRCRGW
jgi:branched-chain amino acid transport system permease protein